MSISNTLIVALVVMSVSFAPASLAQEAAASQSATTNAESLQPSSITPLPPPAESAEIIIGSGDLLEVSVYGAPEFNKQLRVADSGEIALPLIGSVHAAGLTLRQAELLVQQRLAEGGFFSDPQVSIFVKEYATQGISVLGEVQKPGIYPLLGPRKLWDAISAAGGFTPKAGNTITVTHRARPTDSLTVVVPPNQTFPPGSNADVFPGDTVVVSKAGIVYVVGDVRLPGGFVLENAHMSVLQAIAMAQGTNTTAKLDKTVLIRKGADGPQEIPVRLTQIMAAKLPDIKLQPDDVVFVPRSAGKAAARRSLEAILQAATGVIIYRP
jgi:polysaccharide biosynthesis/export protein